MHVQPASKQLPYSIPLSVLPPFASRPIDVVSEPMSMSRSFSSDHSDSGSGGGGGPGRPLAPGPFGGATRLEAQFDSPYVATDDFSYAAAGTSPAPYADSYNEHRYPSHYDPGSEHMRVGGTSLYDYHLDSPELNPTEPWTPRRTDVPDIMKNRLRAHTAEYDSASALAELGVEDAGDFIREKLSLSPEDSLTLEAIPDPPAGQRPSISLPHLAMLVIHNSPRKMLTLQEIYSAIEKRFEWYQQGSESVKKKWQGSIRHALSLKSIFKHKPRPITEPGKGQYWFLDPSQGDGYKRERRRKNRNVREEDEEDFSDGDGDRESAGSAEHDPESGPVRTLPTSVSGRRRSPYTAPSSSSNTLRTSARTPSRPLHASTSQLHPTPNQYSSGSSGYQNENAGGGSYVRSGFCLPSLVPQNVMNPAFGHPSFPIQPSLPPARLFGTSAYQQVEFPFGGFGGEGSGDGRVRGL